MTDIEYRELDDPYAPPRSLAAGAGGATSIPFDPERSRGLVKSGVTAAVFLSIFPFVSFFMGLSTWKQAAGDLELMSRGLMSLEDGSRGKTKAGLVLGKVSTIVSPFALVTLILYVWMVIETS